MKCLFLYNPNSGKGKIRKKIPLIERTLKKSFGEVEIYAPVNAADLADRVRQGADVYDAIIFSGGDGTFNDVLHGMGDKTVKLGYLPSGTANDVARSLGIPRSVKGALKVICGGNTEQVDCMQMENNYIMYVAAAGAFTDVTYTTPQKTKRIFGWFAYVFSLPRYFRFNAHPQTITCGGKSEKLCSALTFVMNGRSVSGFLVNRRASMQDGRMEVVSITGMDRLNFWRRMLISLRIVGFFFFGARARGKHLHRFYGDSVSIQTDNGLVWDFDGERGPKGSVNIRMLPRHVTMFVPKNKKI